jgi:hypothetical protein
LQIMNKRIYTWLGLGAAAVAISANISPVAAELPIIPGAFSGFSNGASIGPNIPFNPSSGSGGGSSQFPAANQASVNQVGQALSANSIGDAMVFDTMGGGSPNPTAEALAKCGTGEGTKKTGATLAGAIQGLRNGDGSINSGKLGGAITAYNSYVQAYVSEVGPEKALAGTCTPLTAIKNVLGNLQQAAAGGAAPAPAPEAAPAPAPAPAPEAAPAPAPEAAPAPAPAPAPEAAPAPAVPNTPSGRG